MSPNTSAMLVGVVLVLSTAITTVLVDRTGRRVLLVLSASIMSLSLGRSPLSFPFYILYYVSPWVGLVAFGASLINSLYHFDLGPYHSLL